MNRDRDLQSPANWSQRTNGDRKGRQAGQKGPRGIARGLFDRLKISYFCRLLGPTRSGM